MLIQASINIGDPEGCRLTGQDQGVQRLVLLILAKPSQGQAETIAWMNG